MAWSPGASEPLGWDHLSLAEADSDTRRLRALLQRSPSPSAGGWKHYPLSIAGNFLTERWLQGEGDVLNGGFISSPGSAWYQVQALHYSLPVAFGCCLSTGGNPASDGVGVRFWYVSGGRTVLGEGADLHFTLWKGGQAAYELPILRIPAGLAEPYELEGSLLEDWWREKLAELASFEGFQAGVSARYQAALVAFRAALDGGRLGRRVYDPYTGGGIPPESRLERLTTRQAHELGRQMEDRVAVWQSLLDQHGQAMYQAFRRVVPLPELLD